MYVVATEYKFHNYMKLTIMYVAKICHTKYIGNHGFYMMSVLASCQHKLF